jgi:hypothetical protein
VLYALKPDASIQDGILSALRLDRPLCVRILSPCLQAPQTYMHQHVFPCSVKREAWKVE